MSVCGCGCGEIVAASARYRKGHNRRRPNWREDGEWRPKEPPRATRDLTKRCEHCGGWMNAVRPEARWCSRVCRNAAYGRIAGSAAWWRNDPYLALVGRDPCSYCGGRADTLDHIVPKRFNGADDPANLTAACRSCNSRKRTRPLLLFLAQGGMRRNGQHRYVLLHSPSAALGGVSDDPDSLGLTPPSSADVVVLSPSPVEKAGEGSLFDASAYEQVEMAL